MASEIGIKLSLAGASQVQGGITAVGTKLGELDSKALKVGDAFKKFGGLLTGALSVGAIGSFLKGAIDAADETFNLSQKVGIAAKDLGGLQLAFKQAGIDSGGMQTALVKLSKNVVDGNAAFGAMGVSLKNTDGSLKTSKQVLSDVANVFQQMPDGIDKTALATEVFGKAGADLIPMLNGGSAGLEEMATMAERLGLVIDDQTAASADQFNDTVELLGLSLQGVGRQVAAEMLPTLTRLAGSLLDSATKGDTLEKVAAILSTALRGLYSVAVGIVEIFNTVGKAIGGSIAAVMAVLQGDFAGAKQILAEAAVDIKSGWSSAGASIANAWEKSGDSSITAAAAIVGAGARSVKSAKELAAEQDKAAKASAAYAAEGLKLADSLVAQDNGLAPDFFDKWGKLQAALAAGKIGSEQFELAQAKLLEQQPYMKAALKEQESATKALEESKKSYLQAFQMLRDAELAEVDDLQKLIAKQREQNDLLGLSREQLAELEQARLRDALAIAEQTLQLRINEGLSGAELEAYTLKVEALRELIHLREEGNARAAVLEEASTARDAWKQTVDSIQNGLTDSLFRAFESGRGFLDAFKTTLVNAFKTMVLQPTIKAIMAPISGAIGSLFSGDAMAGTGSGGGGLGSLLSGGMNLLNGGLGNMMGLNLVNSGLGQSLGLSSVQNIGGNMIAGPTGLGSMAASGLGMLGNGMMGYGISKMLSGGYSAGKGVNILAGIASAIPGIGPIAGVIGGLVNRAFGRKAKEMKDAGITGTITGGDVTGKQFQDWFQKGGWFRSNKSGTNLSEMNADLSAALDFGASGVLNQVQAYAAALKLPADALKSVSTSFRIVLTGEAEADQAAIGKVLGDYQDTLSERFRLAIAPLMKAGEDTSQALARLAGLQTFSEAINDFGGIFSRIAGSSIAAREHLIELAGGIDALMAKAGAFVRDYFTQSEQAGMQARSIGETLAAAGIDAGALGSREDFRALVESLDISTAAGREQLNALLDIAPAFAQLGDYLKDQNLTLAEAARAAPQVAAIEALRGQAQDQAAGIDQVGVQIEAGNSILAQISAGVVALQASIEAGLAAVAVSTAATTRLLNSWDDGGALVTTPLP